MLTPYSRLGGSEDPWDFSSVQTKDPTCIRSSPAKWGKSPPANKEHLTPWPPPVTRMFRTERALDLTMRHQILPKEQWTKYEGKFYLEPYLKEVIRERKEREEWAKK
uniref:Cytochrome b-c1 complex subunit 7 n=1 Tax=Suricata suricatta TaxID=37032 RepID=A0A673U1A5_SURSU